MISIFTNFIRCHENTSFDFYLIFSFRPLSFRNIIVFINYFVIPARQGYAAVLIARNISAILEMQIKMD